MNAKFPQSTQAKIASSLIIALVVVGTAFVSNIGGVAQGNSVMTKLFLVFFGAIIALQVIPGLVLIGAMIKGIVTINKREQAHETDAGK
jgi:hypothetical protein